MTDSPSPAATKASWRIQALPEKREGLELHEAYSPAEFERIKAGLVPVQMEDKWFIYFDSPWLYIHRSWTGYCIYGVRFEESPRGATVVESWASRNTDQHLETRADYDQALLKFLIEALLLRKVVAFPVPSSAAGTPAGLYQHAVVGRAYPEAVHGPREENPRVPDETGRLTGPWSSQRAQGVLMSAVGAVGALVAIGQLLDGRPMAWWGLGLAAALFAWGVRTLTGRGLNRQ